MDSLIRRAFRINSPRPKARAQNSHTEGGGISQSYDGSIDSQFDLSDNALAVGSLASTGSSMMSTGNAADVTAMSTSTSSASSSASSLPPSPTTTSSMPLVTYTVKYLGSTLVDSVNGQDVCAKAIKRIVTMSRHSVTSDKVGPVTLTVSPNGVTVSRVRGKAASNSSSNDNDDVCNDDILIDIYRVAHCAVDDKNHRIFAIIARNTINDTLECHAFNCGKKQTAEVVCLTLAHAFQSAYDNECNERNYEQVRQQLYKQQRQVVSGSVPTNGKDPASSGMTSRGSQISLPVSMDCPYSAVSIHTNYNPIQTGEYLMDFSMPDEDPHGISSTPNSNTYSTIQVKEFEQQEDGDDEFVELARARRNVMGASVAMSTSSSLTSSPAASAPAASHHQLLTTSPIPIPMQHVEGRFNKLQLRA